LIIQALNQNRIVVEVPDLAASNKKSVIRVLHVDDDSSLLDISKQVLMDMGTFKIDNAYSVDEAFNKLANQSYDVVVSDYEMPLKNGLQFLQELREQKNDIPFILFTGKGREEVVVKALNLGADHYVNKNGDPETVYFELAHAINLTVEQERSKSKMVFLKEFGERVIDSVSDALIVIDPIDYTIIDANKAALKQLKSVKKDLIGKTCYEATHHRLTACASPQDACPIEEAIKTGKPSVMIHQHFDKNNKPIDVEVAVHPVKDKDGKIVQIIHISKDISECKNIAKEKTKESNEVNKILDGIGDLLFVMDRNQVITRVNKSTCDALKKKPEELIGKHCYEVVHGTNKPWLNCPAGKTFKTKQTFTAEINDPNIGVPLLITTSPILDEKGELIQCVHIAKDITEQKKAELAINANLKRYQSFIEVTGELGWTTNVAGEVVEDIPSFRNFTGQTYNEVKGWGWTKAVHPEDVEHATRAWQAAVSAKTKYEVEFRLRRFDGVYRNFMARGAPIFEEDGKIHEWVGTCIDVTERKETEEKLANLKQFDERIIDSLDEALLVIDPEDYKIISTNEAALKQLKLSKKELIGKTCFETTHHSLTPCNSPEHICPIRRVLETKEPITVEHKHFDKNNNERIVEVSARLVKNPEGKTVIIHVTRDITERKQMETRIIEAEKRYRTLFDQAPVGIVIIDPEAAVPVEFNELAHQQLGYSRDEFARLRIFDYKVGETPEETKARLEKVLREGRVEFETKHRTKNGEIRDIVATSRAIELSGKKLVHSIYRDVTEAKKMENALMESEAMYRQLVELAQEGVWALDNDSLTVFVNPRMAKMLGYSESEMIGKNLVTFLEKSDSNLAKHNLEECKLGNQGRCEFEFIQKDGTHMNANIAASSIRDDAGNSIGTLALVADITERKKTEESLKKSEQKYREFANSLPEIVFEADDKGKITFENKQAVEIIGYSKDELQQMNVFEFLIPEDRQKAVENIQKRIQGEKSSGSEFMFLKKDGGTFPGLVFSEKILLEDGKLGLRGVIVNISQLKKAEEQLKEERKRIELINEKLRVVGSLTRHDVRNKLSTVTGYAYILKKKHADQADIVDGLGKMEQAVKETVRIFDFAKMYEQLGIEDLTPINVEAKLNEACTLFSGSTPTIINECRGLTILADSFLRQLFYNFIDNTRKYGKKTTTIRVYYEKTDQDNLKLVYEDDGVGVPFENKQHLFKEGFSTGGSTGFGLFLTKKMIEVYSWTIIEEGEPGKGAKFTITIPKLNKNGKENYQIIP
jgi:PAS domain S-box-containing protein